MSHIYSEKFFDYIDGGARRSARLMLKQLKQWFTIDSVVDFGCGRGAWLAEWLDLGTGNIQGLDGTYVDLNTLAIPENNFLGVDLTEPIELGRSFDLAQSLEVGEHLPTGASPILVESLTKHSDVVLFSAAVPGQGGEFHVNEQPLSFWQKLFDERGYSAYDCLRPLIRQNRDIEPWYRYNSVLYANEAGAKRLPDNVLSSLVAHGDLSEIGDTAWMLRRAVVRHMPQSTVTRIAQWRASYISRRFKEI